ncbi:MAG: Sir2 family NAD-dependent protein deacetylase [Crocinitomix sp.]|nr:Sir2 family NAD-dependent protein deacetylase [Crocinitomix sp.]
MEKSRKKVVILSGAGISAESGLSAFRDNDGLWEKYDINQVATIDAWHKNPALVLSFYDARRIQVLKAVPNAAHFALAELEKHFDVVIITQNIDDLHERSGSTNVLHLHGEILKGRSVKNDANLYDISENIKLGDLAPDGHQMRPHIVWFGEQVPKMLDAEHIVKQSDILIVVGTSLNVYPAAGLRYACPDESAKFIVDPNNLLLGEQQFIHFQGSATEKIPLLVNQLIRDYKNS